MHPSDRRTSLRFPVSASMLVIAALGPSWVSADVVTGTVTPADAKAIVVNAAGETVAQLKPGAYQLQLPVGKYKAKCSAPKAHEQDFLVLSEPVTVNVDCAK